MTVPQTGLKFYEASHRYKLDGQWVPGVTTLIGKGLPKPALPRWSAKTVAEWVAAHPDITEQMERAGGPGPLAAFLKELPWQARDTAAIRGTDVHALAEKLIHGEEVTVPEHLAGHVESYVQFLDRWQPKPVLVEACVGSRQWRYAGKLDLVADLPAGVATLELGERPLLDVKTSSGVYPETSFQLAGYRFAEFYVDGDEEKPMADLGITGAGVIHVRADGYDLIPMRADEHVWKRFLHISHVARTADEMKAYVGAPLPEPEVAA